MYHTYPTYCPRCDVFTPTYTLLDHPRRLYAIRTRTGPSPIPPTTPPLVKYCEYCSYGGVDALKTGMALSVYLRAADDEAYALMVEQSIETQRIHRDEEDLQERMNPRGEADGKNGTQGGKKSLKEKVKEMVHPATISKKFRKFNPAVDGEAMDFERGQIRQCMLALQQMRKPETPSQKANRERKEGKAQRRFAQEMEKLVRVGKMRLGGDPAWKDEIGPYSEDGNLKLELEEDGGWFMVKVVKPVWYWLRPDKRELEIGFF